MILEMVTNVEGMIAVNRCSMRYTFMLIKTYLHTASTDDALLRNLAKVWMIKDEFDNDCFSILTKIFNICLTIYIILLI